MRHRSTDKSAFFNDLKRQVASMEDPEIRSITEHMIVVMAALEVGTNLDRLVARTGYPREFIEGISSTRYAVSRDLADSLHGGNDILTPLVQEGRELQCGGGPPQHVGFHN